MYFKGIGKRCLSMNTDGKDIRMEHRASWEKLQVTKERAKPTMQIYIYFNG